MVPKLAGILAFLWRIITDMRGLVVVLALASLFFLGQGTWTGNINELLFRSGVQLMEAPETDQSVVIVTLPASGVRGFQEDPQLVSQLADFLRQSKAVKPAATAIILDELSQGVFDNRLEQVEARLTALLSESAEQDYPGLSNLLAITGEMSDVYADLQEAIQANDVMLGARVRSSSSGAAEMIHGPGFVLTGEALEKMDQKGRTYYEWLPGTALPPAMPVYEKRSEQAESVPAWGEASLVFTQTPGQAARPMLWQQNGNYYPFAATRLFGRLLNHPDPVWVTHEALKFGTLEIKTDFAGRVNLLLLDTRFSGRKIRHMTLGDTAFKANLLSLKKKIVLVGREGDDSLRQLALSIQSLSSKFTSHTPFWAVWAEKGLILFFCLYLVFITPRLRLSLGVVLGLFLVFVTLTVQLGLHLIHGQWVPLAASLLFFISGHVLMLIRHQGRRRLQALAQKADDALLQLGTLQFEQHAYDQAFESLSQCRPRTEVLELLFDIGIECERRLQYKKALAVFRHIHHHRKGFKDVAARVSRLPDLADGTLGGLSSTLGTVTKDLHGFEMQRIVMGRYQIERMLGRGAMGIVYLGHDPKIGRSVAIKTLDFSQALTMDADFGLVKKRFFREAEAIGRLNHPNIVTIYDVGEEEDLAFIIMDYVEGETLNLYTQKKELLPVATVFQVVKQVAEALDYAHRQNIIHRDIKPSNIIYNKAENLVKVTDFGIARFMDTTRTATNAILGSPSFMSPEQLKRSSVDGRADIFSLGVTFYLLLTGQFPFTGEDLVSLTYQIANTKHPDVRSARKNIPESAAKIINKSLQKRPDRRFKTAQDMAAALAEGLTRLPVKKKKRRMSKKAADTDPSAAK